MRFDVDSNMDLGMAQFQLLADAMSRMSATGPNAALQGTSGALSGRAKQLDQEGGALTVGVVFDRLRNLQLRVARMTWNRVRQFWTEETWIRVTDDEQKLRFVGFNVPTTAGELAAERLKKMPMPLEQKMQMVEQLAVDPRAQQVVRRNEVAQMDMDIIIDEAPDTITLQAEQFSGLVDLARAGVVFPRETYIEASGLRNKKRLIEMIRTDGEQTPEQQQEMQRQKQMQEAAMMLELRGKAADVAETEASAEQKRAQAEKSRVDAAVALDQAAQLQFPTFEMGNGSAAGA
jgi:hypothetical protein